MITRAEKIVGSGFAVFAAVVMWWLVDKFFDLNAEGWAAWVQAIGSVGAILGSVWIADRQHRRAEITKAKQERDERIQAFRGLRDIISHARDGLRTMTGRFPENGAGPPQSPIRFNEKNVLDAYDVLRRVPLHLPIYLAAAVPVLNAVTQIRAAIDIIQLMNDPGKPNEFNAPKHWQAMSNIIDRVTCLARELDPLIARENARTFE